VAHEFLSTYLSDHSAGAQAALEILGLLRKTGDSELWRGVEAEIGEDRAELERLMHSACISSSTLRRAAAWTAEKLAEFKLRVDDPSTAGAFRRLELIEALAMSSSIVSIRFLVSGPVSLHVITARSIDFITRQNAAGRPFFLWVTLTHMHMRTHTKPESVGQAGEGQSLYHDSMIDHDKNVGTVLKALDDLGIANNTFVVYSTDNGPHMNSWPDAGMTPFRSEKNTNWEGAYRVPEFVRWPGHITPGTVCNEMIAHHDWLPTILAVAGDAQITDKLVKGYKVGDMTYHVHPDGYNLLPLLTGQTDKGPRKSFIYINDDQQVVALRYENWKIVFEEQRAEGTLRIWAEPFTPLRVPKIFNLRTDPYERADVTSNTYYDWLMDHVFALVPAQAFITDFIMTFKDYPQRQKAENYNLEEVLRRLQQSSGSR
jgi:hypothetical protein